MIQTLLVAILAILGALTLAVILGVMLWVNWDEFQDRFSRDRGKPVVK